MLKCAVLICNVNSAWRVYREECLGRCLIDKISDFTIKTCTAESLELYTEFIHSDSPLGKVSQGISSFYYTFNSIEGQWSTSLHLESVVASIAKLEFVRGARKEYAINLMQSLNLQPNLELVQNWIMDGTKEPKHLYSHLRNIKTALRLHVRIQTVENGVRLNPYFLNSFFQDEYQSHWFSTTGKTSYSTAPTNIGRNVSTLS